MKTEETILERVFDLFLERGISETSTNEIIREVKLTKGGFYYIFKSRDDLIQRVIAKYIKPYYMAPIGWMETIWQERKNSSTEDLLWNCFFEPQRFAHYIEEVGKTVNFRDFYFLIHEGIKKHPQVASYAEQNMEARQALLRAILERGQVRKEIIPNLNIAEFSLLVLALQDGILALKVMDDRIDEEEKFGSIKRQVLRDISIKETFESTTGGVDSAVS